MNTLYIRIKELAKENGQSLAQVERDLHFSNGIISTWKTGKATADKVKAVADHFGVTTDYLLNSSTEEKHQFDGLSEFKQSVNGLFRTANDKKMSQEDKKTLDNEFSDYLAYRAERLRKKKEDARNDK